MNLTGVLALIGAAAAGYALVRWTSISTILAAGIGLVAAVAWWTYDFLFGEDLSEETGLWLTVLAIALGAMFAAWLAGVCIAALMRPRK